MTDQANSGKKSVRGYVRRVLLLAVPFLGACGAATARLPEPRPVVIYSGERLRIDADRVREIDTWVTREQQNITEDPGFLVQTDTTQGEVYPWEGLSFGKDTVRVKLATRYLDANLPFQIYGHLHLMARSGRQEEWLPEAPTATGYELERAILKRVSDVWLLGRTVFNTAPYAPLDELIYSSENGYLEEFIFTARPEEFAEARERWVAEHAGKLDAFRAWFLDTFDREPPGLR